MTNLPTPLKVTKPQPIRRRGMDAESADVYRVGSYEIHLDQRIGVGGYSVVYLGTCVDPEVSARHNINRTIKIPGRQMEHVVAVKKIIVKGLSFKHQKMIGEEINIMKHIRENPHPNIVVCYDVIDDLDTIYIVMEYCDSGDLSRLIGEPIKEEGVRYYLRQLIHGLKYLDEHKIIHRDIKPKNILLTDERRILKICDFGLAKNKAGLSRINTICGSPLYMAPEMFGERSYNDTVDVWSVGIIMYEMLYGANPLSRMKDYSELESFMVNEEDIAVPPRNGKNKNRRISTKCLDLLRMLLRKESDDRLTLRGLYDHPWLVTPLPGDIADQQDERDDAPEGDMMFELE